VSTVYGVFRPVAGAAILISATETTMKAGGKNQKNKPRAGARPKPKVRIKAKVRFPRKPGDALPNRKKRRTELQLLLEDQEALWYATGSRQSLVGAVAINPPSGPDVPIAQGSDHKSPETKETQLEAPPVKQRAGVEPTAR